MKVSLEEAISVLEAGIGEVDYVIPSDILEAAVEHLKNYKSMKVTESWRENPEAMGLR